MVPGHHAHTCVFIQQYFVCFVCLNEQVAAANKFASAVAAVYQTMNL